MTPPLNRKRSSSVSFTRAKDESEEGAEEIHISLAPYVQTYLAHSGQGIGCCGVKLPVPFERAAPRSWWNPKFDSEILEEQYKRSAFPQIRLRFRYALTYILLISLSWLVYFVITGMQADASRNSWSTIAAIFSTVGAMVSAVFYLTHTEYYKRYTLSISISVALMLCFLSLLFLSIVPPYIDGLTLVGHFALCTEILLLIYTVLPMPLYACVGISAVYSFMFEFLTAYLYGSRQARHRFLGERVISVFKTAPNSGCCARGTRQTLHPSVRTANITRGKNRVGVDRAITHGAGVNKRGGSNLDSGVAGAAQLSSASSSPLFRGQVGQLVRPLERREAIAVTGARPGLTTMTTTTMTTTTTTAAATTPASTATTTTGHASILLSILGLAAPDENAGQGIVHRIAEEPSRLVEPATAFLASFNASIPSSTVSDSVDMNDTSIRITGLSNLSYAGNVSSEFPVGLFTDFSTNLAIRVLMQLCIHLIGVHILIMTFVRMRGTFMKVGQSLLVRRQLEMEKQLKEKMIHSVMPPKVADWLMEEGKEREDSLKKGSIPSNNTDIRSLFRPFNMHSMENVSILFADIVGFTRMSSNKTAEELVGILNDLFERFDDLCEHHGCEKISTLGDCYYCVSGCPEPRADHAKCCIEMGLAMIEAIKQFDIERREGVNMRVGVHTGTVLCGIVGTKRFKFDVWSNDVTLANKLESTGKPGRVHLSEKTLSFLNDQYFTEEGDLINGVKTYFIKARKTDFASQFLNNAPTSPKSISPMMQSRHRLSSCNNQSKSRHHYLHMVTNANSCRIKANSLPSILDSENDGDTTDGEKEDANKSPISTASYGKKKSRQKPWKYLQRQRTTEEMTPLEREQQGKPMPLQPTPPPPPRLDPPSPINQEEHNGFTSQASTKDVVEMDPNPVPSSPLLSGQEVPLSRASSICSRKDSGIKSNSRRSSIQQQLFLMNGMAQGDLLAHRVSGYYTSSSTLNSTQEASPCAVPPYPFPPVVTDTFGACFHKLRKQSDLQLIRCVQDNVSSQRSYFVKPPLSSVTLFFKSKEMEKEYRENAHKVSECTSGNPPTLATSRFNTYFDILISALVYTGIAISLFLLCEPSIYYTVFFVLATVIQTIAVLLCVRQLIYPNSIHGTTTQRIFKFFSRWYPWHLCGAVLVGLPVASILLNFSCNGFHSLDNFEYYYGYLMFVGLVHFCNFTQLNCWMKNVLVTITGVAFLCLITSRPVHLPVDGPPGQESSRLGPFIDFPYSIERPNGTREPRTVSPHQPLAEQPNLTSFIGSSPSLLPRSAVLEFEREIELNYNQRLYGSEIFLDMILLLLLVWFLNREFEISYRLSFHGNAVAARDKSRVQSMKNQADWLLHNIIPKYVADQLKTTAKYSQNHKSVGIIFASIVNFNELYDESYLGGKEYLRVLNELIGDFDELLERPEFSNVEKIKTIGSTFMAASGLNPTVREQSEHRYTHIFQLVDFAIAMHKVIYDFNRDLLGFKLILRIGFNYGDVTAGVIGATKLYYDIWGDAVNIASRMDSTGVAGRIQVASNCLEVLSERYQFEPRGQVYVKGKDNMDVYLLIGKRTDTFRDGARA